MIRPILAKKIFEFIEEKGLNPDQFKGYALSETDPTMPWRLTFKIKEKPYFDISCPSSFNSFRISRSKYSPKHIVSNIPPPDRKQELSETQLFSELKSWLMLEAKPAQDDYESIISEYTSIVDNKDAIRDMISDYNRIYKSGMDFDLFREKLRIEITAAKKILVLALRDKLIEGLPTEMKDTLHQIPEDQKLEDRPPPKAVPVKSQSHPKKLNDWTWPIRISILAMTLIGLLLVGLIWANQEINSFFKFLDKHLAWIATLYFGLNGFFYLHYWKRRS